MDVPCSTSIRNIDLRSARDIVEHISLYKASQHV